MEIRVGAPKLSPLAYGIVSNRKVGAVHILLNSIQCDKSLGVTIERKAGRTWAWSDLSIA